MPVFSVFAVSLSTLFFEVLLNRSFAIGQSVHLAFMVISIAMFGYSAGSIWMHVRIARPAAGRAVRRAVRRALRRALPPIAQTDRVLGLPPGVLPLVTGAFILVAWKLQLLLPFEALEVPFSPIQVVYLAALFLFLAVPFFFVGVITSVGFAERTSQPGVVYAASMIGGAVGAVVPALLLPRIGFSGCVLLSAGVAAVPSLIRRSVGPRLGSIAFLALVGGLFLIGPDLDPRPSSYKALERFMQHPDARILSTEESITGRIDTYNGHGFHAAPGLSLSYRGPIPTQTGVFTDGESSVALYGASATASAEDYRFALASVGAAPFSLVPRPKRVLVVLEGGGTAIAAALASGATEVEVLAFPPGRAAAVSSQYGRRGVTVTGGPLRRSIGRLVGRYDLILIDHPGSSVPGMTSINEDFLLTTEAMAELLSHLDPDGILAVTRRLQIPPSDSLKAFAIASDVLKQIGCSNPREQTCILRSYNTYSLMVSRTPISDSDKGAIKEFAIEHGFDMVHLDGLHREDANKNNRRPSAIYYDAVDALAADLESGSDEFTKSYYVDISAPRDNRPYFNRFVRWRALKELFDATGGRAYPFYFAGEILVVILFGVALLFSGAIIVTPALTTARRKKRRLSTDSAVVPYLSVISLLLGVGFMFFEIGWIKGLIPLTGSPSLSFTAVVAIILVASGLGGWLSERVKNGHLLTIGILGIAALAGSTVAMRLVLPVLPGMSAPSMWIIVSVLVAVPGILLGMPLPLTMRILCRDATDQILGWAFNGTASVLASVGSAGMALLWGIQSLLLIALGVYLGVFCLWFIVLRVQRHSQK